MSFSSTHHWLRRGAAFLCIVVLAFAATVIVTSNSTQSASDAEQLERDARTRTMGHNLSSRRQRLQTISLPSVDVESLSFWMGSGTDGTSVRARIYGAVVDPARHSGYAPDFSNLIAESSTVNVDTAGEWVFSFSPPVSLAADVHFIGAQHNGNAFQPNPQMFGSSTDTVFGQCFEASNTAWTRDDCPGIGGDVEDLYYKVNGDIVTQLLRQRSGFGTGFDLGTISQPEMAQTFTAPAQFEKVLITACATKDGSPTDGIVAELRDAVSGIPVGSFHAVSQTLDESEIPESFQGLCSTEQFEFEPASLLSAGEYSVVLKRTGALSDSDHYTLWMHTTADYVDGAAASYDGSNWTSQTTEDIYGSLSILATSEEILTTTSQGYAQTFTLSTKATGINVDWMVTGNTCSAPSDVHLSIQGAVSDGAGGFVPDGVEITNLNVYNPAPAEAPNVSLRALSDSLHANLFDPGQYALVIERAGAIDDCGLFVVPGSVGDNVSGENLARQDSAGVWVADIASDSGIVITPDDFIPSLQQLDNTRATLTMGHGTANRRQRLQAVTLPDIDVDSIAFWLDNGNSNQARARARVYGAVPNPNVIGGWEPDFGNFIAQSSQVTLPGNSAGAEYELTFATSVSLTEGVYFIGVENSGGSSHGNPRAFGSTGDVAFGECFTAYDAAIYRYYCDGFGGFVEDLYYKINEGTISTTQEIKVAVILVESLNGTMAANTADRIKNSDPQALDDMDSLLRSYFCENSFGDYDDSADTCPDGLVSVSLDVFTDDNDAPFKLDHDIEGPPECDECYGMDFPGGAMPHSAGYDGSSPQRDIKLDAAKDQTIDLLWEAINKANNHHSSLNFNDYEAVVVVYEGRASTGVPGEGSEPNRPETFAWPVHFAPSNPDVDELAKNWIPMAETWEVGAWAHELAHVLGEVVNDKYLCDLNKYELGCGVDGEHEIGPWDLMAQLGPHLGSPAGSQPSNLSSYSKIEIGWLNEQVVIPGPFSVTGLGDMELGDSVQAISLVDEPLVRYLVEARTKDNPWDVVIPELATDDALLIYRVRENYRGEIVYPEQAHESVRRDIVRLEKRLASADPQYDDDRNNIRISLDSFVAGPPFLASAEYEVSLSLAERFLAFANPDNQILESIEGKNTTLTIPAVGPPIPESERRKRAFILAYEDRGLYLIISVFLVLAATVIAVGTRQKRLASVPSLIGWLFVAMLILLMVYPMMKFVGAYENRLIGYPRYYPPTEEGQEATILTSPTHMLPDPEGSFVGPDTDLHAYDDQGNHVGVNYQTGEYENQIPGAHTSGDRLYDEEWISVPEGTNVHFEVSTHDIDEFLAENPDIAASLSSTEETYEFGAVTYDASSNRYESAPVENIAINPGETRVHTIGGTTEAPTVDEGVVIVELEAAGDSYPRKGSPNKNYGDEVTTWIRGSGNRSVLIQFDQQEIENAVGEDTLLSAELVMETVDGTASSWGANGKDVGTYRLTHPWTELGVTWNCGNDTDTSNGGTDCPGETWEMNQTQGPSWDATPSDEVHFDNDTSGTIVWDVLSHISDWLTGTDNYGWIVRKDADGSQGQIEFHSRETTQGPRLILEIER